MTTLIAAASIAVALGGPSANSTTEFVSASHAAPKPVLRQGKPCRKLYRIPMAQRAIEVTYFGTRDVSIREYRNLFHYVRCQRIPSSTAYLIRFENSVRRAWHRRRNPPLPQMYYQLASWYEDAGATASGWHATYGVANKSLPFGTRVVIRYHGAQVNAIVDDRGPYVGGRVWDLNQNVAGALGFSGVDVVQVSVLG